jgi:protein gp37
MSNAPAAYATRRWNPTTGCSPISAGCANCWARRFATRHAGRFGYPKDNPFAPTCHPDRLDEPLRWRKPQVVAVSFMGDLFHEKVDNNAAYGYPFIASVFGVMASRPDHTFLLLTKRPERAREILAGPDRLSRLTCPYHAKDRVKHPGLMCPSDGPWPLPNVWIGPSVWDQPSADAMIPVVLDTPAAHRWVSIEPQVGPVDLTGWLRTFYSGDWTAAPGTIRSGAREKRIDLVVQGCESGPRRRPFNLQWARDVRDQCKAAGVAYALKQRQGCTYDECHCWEPGNECGNPDGCDEHRDRTVIEDHVLDGKVEWNLPWEVPA